MKSDRFIKTLKLFWISENQRVHTAILINCFRCAGQSAEHSAFKTGLLLYRCSQWWLAKWKGRIDSDSACIEKWKPGVLMFWGPTWLRKSPTVLPLPTASKSFIQAAPPFQLKCEVCCPFFLQLPRLPGTGQLKNRSILEAEGCSVTNTATHMNPVRILFRLLSGFWHSSHSFLTLSKACYYYGLSPRSGTSRADGFVKVSAVFEEAWIKKCDFASHINFPTTFNRYFHLLFFVLMLAAQDNGKLKRPNSDFLELWVQQGELNSFQVLGKEEWLRYSRLTSDEVVAGVQESEVS